MENKSSLKSQIEKALGAALIHGWITDGAGAARFGWGSVHRCKTRWEGKSLAQIFEKLASAC